MILRRRVSALNLCLAAVLIALAAGGAYALWGGGDSPAEAVSRTAEVTTTDVTATVTASGTAAPKTVKDASFDGEGTVDAIDVAVGDKVSKGDVLATATSPTAGTQVSSAQASYDSALANYTAVKDKTKDADSTDKNQQRSSAWAQVEQSRLSLVEAQNAYAGLTLRAPMDGTVTAVNGTKGESTTSTSSTGTDSSSATGFITVSNLKKFVVTGSFSEADVARIKVGKTASITFNAIPDKTFAGKVTSIDLTSTQSDGVTTYGVVMSVEDPPSNLRGGATASITITTASAANALAVPTSAVTTTDGASTVKLVTNGKATPTDVTIGVEGDTYTEIKAGLAAGDTIELGAVSTSSGSGFPGGGFPGGGLGGGRTVTREAAPGGPVGGRE